MPFVLTQNKMSAADIVYADELGISHEYPARYRSLVETDEHFIYYRGQTSGLWVDTDENIRSETLRQSWIPGTGRFVRRDGPITGKDFELTAAL